MWNPSQDDGFGQTQASQPEEAGADPYAEVTWSSGQLARMENEWRRLQRAFAYHPHVTLTPLAGDPPSSYQVDFRLTTVIVNPRTSQLEYVANPTVQVILPPGFPEQPPTVKPVTAIFHPNVSYEGFHLEGLWHPNETLLGLIRKVGDVLAYRLYDPDYAVNPAAMDWLIANHSILPIDGQANLSPQAGGEPLDRIAKYGPQSLESMKQSVLATQTSLFGNSAPDPQTVRRYAAMTRMALNVFIETDVPEHLRAGASDLDEAARELVTMAPLYDFVRERRRRITIIRNAARALSASRAPLAAEIDKLIGLVSAAHPDEPMLALKLIPPSSTLQPLQFSMPRLIDEAEKKFAAIRSGIDGIRKLQQPALVPTDSLLGTRLDRELATGEAEADAAILEGEAALAEFEPLLNRAGSEATALDFAVRWREYLDMADKARLIERLIRQNGAEGLHAYYIEREGQRFGPYQFEQSIDLGAGEVLIRNNAGKTIELWDHKRDKPLATNDNGVMLVALPAPPPEPGEEVPVDANGRPVKRTIPTKFLMTDRCDDLVVLLEYLRRSAIEIVQKFAAYNGDAQSWAGAVCRVLSRPEVKKAIEEELAGAARRWRHTIIDLAALSPWKERLATYFLVRRCAVAIPDLAHTISDSRSKIAASKKRVADIVAKSHRDVDTGSLIVPPRFSRAYESEIALQEQCETAIKVSTVRLRSLVSQLTFRLQDPKRLGKADAPALRVVPALPAALAALPLSDPHLGNAIAPLEQLLQTPLGGPAPGAVDPETAATEEGEAWSEQPAETQPAYAEGYAEQPEEAYAENAEGYAENAEGYAENAEGYAESSEAYEQTYGASAYTEEGQPSDAVTGYGEPGQTEQADGGLAEDGTAEADGGVDTDGHAVTDEATGVADENADYAAADDQASTDGWVVAEDEDETATAYGEGEYEQSDVVFGFEPDPSPPTSPGGKAS